MTEAVVDHLEVVDVDEEHRERAALADGPLLGSAEDVEELGPVRELGQPVVGRFVREGVLVRAPLGHITAVEHDAPHVGVVHEVRCPHLEPPLRPVRPQQHELRRRHHLVAGCQLVE